MGYGKEKKPKKPFLAILKEGFSTLKLLDNTNVYGVVFSECVSNIFKEGMWQKVLSPYMLFLTNHNKAMVGNMITVNSTIRATVGVVAGRFLINRLGADSCFCIAGVVGIAGIFVNIFSLAQGSVVACFLLNAVWGIYTGLWNSCLEVAWARSLLRDYREDVSNARQVLNKLTTAAGPLLSMFIFYYYGNVWTIPMIVNVMLIGTAFTALPVILCFKFDRIHEIRQELYLCDIKSIVFTDHIIYPDRLQRDSFIQREDSFIKLSYPIKATSKYGKLRVFTPDLRETDYILGKQFRAWFKEMEHSYENVCVLNFQDPSRDPVRVSFDSFSVFLKKDGKINTTFSQVVFHLCPKFSKPDTTTSLGGGLTRGVSKLFGKSQGSLAFAASPSVQRSELLLGESSKEAGEKEKKKKEEKKYEPNIWKANMIVCCDVLNAVGSGMSLKFMDLFLIETYGLSPGGTLFVQVLQNVASATLTPIAKQTMNFVRGYGFKSAFGVVLIWAAGCFFMAVLCVPDMNLYVVIASIVLMNSLFSCTKAYNRARLINALPHDRVANYMVWDSLNKANQGGVTILGAQVVQWGGYLACFRATLFFLLLRWALYTGYSLHKGVRSKKKKRPGSEDEIASQDDEGNVPKAVRRSVARFGDADEVVTEVVEIEAGDHEDDDTQRRDTETDEADFSLGYLDGSENVPDEADSELFPPSLNFEHNANGLLVVHAGTDTDEGTNDAYDECPDSPLPLETNSRSAF